VNLPRLIHPNDQPVVRSAAPMRGGNQQGLGLDSTFRGCDLHR
jgi:hypothetical protein